VATITFTECRRCVVSFALTALFLPGIALGQTQVRSFAELQSRLKASDLVVVTDNSGQETTGRIAEISPHGISLAVMNVERRANRSTVLNAAGTRSFADSDIALIHRTDPTEARRTLIYAAPGPFQSLQGRLRVGDEILVTDAAGQVTVNKVKTFAPSTLSVLTRRANPRDGSGRPRYEWTDEHAIDLSNTQRIGRPGPIWDGALKGAIFGLIPAVILAAACHGCSGNA
jgi:hypothetical protein